MRVFRVAFILVLLAACAPRAELGFADAPAPGADLRTVFVGTTRVADEETGHPARGRTLQERFARYDIAIPTEREIGTATWPRPGQQLDPRRHFSAVDSVLYTDAAAFRAGLARALTREPHGMREAVIFVHGFNTTFAEGLYRVAQLAHDYDLPAVPVHYAWPSAANPLGYVYDRDSALYARDGLERLIVETVAAGAERVVLVGHSMGAHLLMEALRQIAIADERAVLRRIGGVVLISPDIDVEVFHAQAGRIGRLPQPFVIFTSQRDRALQLSARLTGQRDRLGNVTDVEEVAELEVTLLEVGAFTSGTGHFTVGTSPALMHLLGNIGAVDAAFGLDNTGRPGFLPFTILTVRNATQIVLFPVSALADATQ